MLYGLNVFGLGMLKIQFSFQINHVQGSWAWSGILEGLSVIDKGHCWIVGPGTDIRALNHQKVDNFDYPTGLRPNLKDGAFISDQLRVPELMIDGQRS